MKLEPTVSTIIRKSFVQPESPRFSEGWRSTGELSKHVYAGARQPWYDIDRPAARGEITVSIQTRSLDFRKRRRAKRGSALAEFGPVLFVFLFFALFPLLDLMAVAIGTASISLAARQGASAAAASADYGTGLLAMERDVNAVRTSGFGQFLNLRPMAGYNGSGADLWIEKTNIIPGTPVQFCGPNSKAPLPIDSTAFIYEYACYASFQVGPLCNLGAVPFIGSIPGLGPPAQIRYVAQSAVEYPTGLSSGAPATGAWSNTVP
jgi:hypothetical protein